AGMAYTNMGMQVFAYGFFFQLSYFSFLFINFKSPVVQRYAGTVIAPVFEALQTFYNNRIGFTGPGVSNNSAHVLMFSNKDNQRVAVVQTIVFHVVPSICPVMVTAILL